MVNKKRKVMKKNCIGCEDYGFCKRCEVSYIHLYHPKDKKIEKKIEKIHYLYLNIRLDDYRENEFFQNRKDLTNLVSSIFFSTEICDGRTVHFKDPILDALLDNIRKSYFRYLKINEEDCKNRGYPWFDYNLEVGKNLAYKKAIVSLEKKASHIIKSVLKRKKKREA